MTTVVPDGLTVPEVAERIERGERQVWNLLARGDLGEPVHREITDRLGRAHLQRVVPPGAVDAYLADRNTQGSGGAGTGSGNGSGSGAGSTNTGGGAGTGSGRRT